MSGTSTHMAGNYTYTSTKIIKVNPREIFATFLFTCRIDERDRDSESILQSC